MSQEIKDIQKYYTIIQKNYLRKAIVATCLVGSLFVHAVFLLSELPSLSYLTLADKMMISIFTVFVGAGVAILLRQHHLNRKMAIITVVGISVVFTSLYSL